MASIFENLKEQVQKEGDTFAEVIKNVVGGKPSTSKKPWETFAHCFVVDYDAPSFVGIGPRIFSLGKDDVDTTPPRSRADVVITTVSSTEEVSDKFEAAVGLSGSYGCFGGSAAMGIDSSTSQKYSTMRVDSRIRSSKFHLTPSPKFRLEPETFVDADIKKYITEGTKEGPWEEGTISMDDLENLEGLVGHFFCRECELGGIFQKTYIVETSATETSTSVQTSLAGSYGAGLVSAKASIGITKSEANANGRMRIKEMCLGGEPAIWQGATENNTDEIRQDWAASIKDDNLFALDVQVDFAWEIVAALNPMLGEKYKDFLIEKWKNDKVDIKDLAHIKPIAPAYESFKSKECGGYMYSSPDTKYDDNTFRVLCWLKAKDEPANNPTMRWEIVEYDGYVGIKSLAHTGSGAKWLYADTEKWVAGPSAAEVVAKAAPLPLIFSAAAWLKEWPRETKRYALVKDEAGDPKTHAKMRWTIQKFGDHVGIKSVLHNEWLCAGPQDLDTDVRKHCFTVKGNPESDAALLWTRE
jgi:hypothetical protein